LSLLSAALLGIVQGLTEFLPVSSSAHLILAREFFGIDLGAGLDMAFDVACHVGTLLAVVMFFWRDLVAMAAALPDALRLRPSGDGRRVQLIVIGTIPVVIVGAFLATWIENSMRTPAIAAAMLLAGAIVFLVVERLGPRTRDESSLAAPDVLAIGVAQSAALVPGVSRSGATIATGMALGLTRESAARFTFLLSIPAVLAAAAKDALDLRHHSLSSADRAFFAVGLVVSAIVGYATIAFFLRYLTRHRLDVFAWYRIALAAVTFLWLATHP
jgi:undecaprenyl-diphosphatase